ncbi:ATP-binding protein [Streptomyces hoynatensis]|nr:ATP-binding protein [Streptomyces hoynatensis]
MHIPAALVVCLAVGSAAAVLGAALWPRRRRHLAATTRRAEAAERELGEIRGRLAEAERRERLLTEEIGHLAGTRIPALATAARHSHVRLPGALHEELAHTEGGRALESLLEEAAAALAAERTRVDGAAQAAMRGATTKLQTMCYQLQTTVDELLHKYDDPDLAERLAALDYLNEQMLRRLQVTRVVCGAGAGLVRTKSQLHALVVGASSRIPSYERVRIDNHLAQPVAVADRAAEPVAIVVAELLANAVHHSHGTLPVEVSLHQAHNGAVVVINDAGIGMNAEEFEQARQLLTGSREIRLADLGDPPRSGFAAIGRLCHQYGIAVSLEPSHYAGVKAVLFVPGELLTVEEEERQPVPHAATPDLATPAVGPIAPPVRGPRAPRREPAADLDPAQFTGEAGGPPAAPAAPPAGVTGEPPHPAADEAGEAGEADGADAPDAAGAVSPRATDPATGELPALPQRRHRRPERPSAADLADLEDTLARDPEDAASRMGALQRGTARGRAEVAGDPTVDDSERQSR